MQSMCAHNHWELSSLKAIIISTGSSGVGLTRFPQKQHCLSFLVMQILNPFNLLLNRSFFP
jgi:hypothetical protein